MYNPQKIKGNACHSRGQGVGNIGSGTNYSTYTMVETVGNDKFPESILHYAKPHASIALHPTQKPIELLEYLIKTYTNEGETVLDNSMGSGSTGVAAKNLNRDFIGIELDENYFEIAKTRILGDVE